MADSTGGGDGSADTIASGVTAAVDTNAATVAPASTRAVDTGGATLAAPATAPGATAPALAFALPPLAAELYDIRHEIGRGGMGRVVAAQDRRLDRPVALKLLQVQEASIAERFRREARITARLQHPGIVPVYEAGRLESGEPFYAMKHVAGRPFDQLIDAATTTRARLELLPNVLAVADALAYAHDHRIVHRDLKPQNVIVGDFGETVVIDWGLAKDLDDTAPDLPAGPYRAGDGNLTMAGSVMGTPAYMPPEQARGDAVDERADVYAIGAMLYHALTGAVVHPGETVDDMLTHAMAATPVTPVSTLAADIPSDLSAIITKALAPVAADRYATSKQLAIDLRRFLAGQLVGVHHYTTRALIWRWIRRHRGVVVVGAGALAVVAVLSVLGLSRIQREREEAIHQRNVAEDQTKKAEIEGDEAILAQAASLTATDPAAAIAWLKRLSPNTTRWTAARTIAADAAHHGIPDLLPAPSFLISGLRGNRVGTALFAWSSLFARVVIYDLATGRSHVVELPDGSPVGPVSPDGRVIAVPTKDAIRIVAVAGGTPRALPDTAGATPRAFSPDGAWLAASSPTGSLLVPLAGGSVRHLPGTTDASLAFTADGASIVEVDQTRVRVYALAGGPPRDLAIATETAVLSDDGAFVAFVDSGDGSLTILTVATGVRTVVPTTHDVRQLSAEGPWLEVDLGEDKLLWPWAGGAPIQRTAMGLTSAHGVTVWKWRDQLWIEGVAAEPEMRTIPGGVSAMWLSDDGRVLVVAAGDGTVRRWQLTPSFEQLVCGGVARLPNIEASPDGRWLVQVGASPETLDVCEPRTNTLRTVAAPTDPIAHFTWSHDGQTVVTSADDAAGLAVWNVPAGTFRRIETKVAPLAVADDATRIIGRLGDDLVALDVATGRTDVRCVGGNLERVSSDLRQAFGGTADAMGGCDIISGKRWQSGAFRDGFDLAIAPDGQTAVATGEHGAVMWNLATHARIELDLGTTEWPRQIAYSSDGAFVMVAAPTLGTIFGRTGAVVRRLRLPPGYLEQIWFAPDATRVVVADQTNGATIYDLATGQRRSLKGNSATVRASYLSGTGAVLSIGGGGEPTIWRWADDLPTDAAGVRAWIAASSRAQLDRDGRLIGAARE